MLPNNMMSFMKKMVATQPEAGTITSDAPEESGTTLSKLRQLGSGLIMATGNVAKLAPAKVTPVDGIQPKEEMSIGDIPKPKTEPASKINSGSDCRVCRKSFRTNEIFRTCSECQQKVCEDCASYSNTTNFDETSTWRCSVCRRKMASREQQIIRQDLTDSLLEVPVSEVLTRRHSDAKLSCQSGTQIGDFGGGLLPPRSSELRRHSDVSPASLKELEKFRKAAGDRRDEIRWEKELEHKAKANRDESPERQQGGRWERASSPQRLGKPCQFSRQSLEQETVPAEVDTGQEEESKQRTRASNGAPATNGPRVGTGNSGSSVRRKSRVIKQRSYDDESKSGGISCAVAGRESSHGGPAADASGLGLPVPPLPRRASACDVYAMPDAGGTLNAISAAAAASVVSTQARDPEERPVVRRSSFRDVKPVLPYDAAVAAVAASSAGAEEDAAVKLDVIPSPMSGVVSPPVLGPDEGRRTRRRGSQLPDINAIRALASSPGSAKPVPPPAAVVARVAAEERELSRQGSLVDGEGIKIVIHDFDSDPVPRINAKRRVKLRRDPLIDKGHRTRGFGMRVIGGKTGADGRTFAYVVWTIPGGPAEKAGLQQGDRILEWSGVSLIDRSFEDVAQIVDDTEDVAELIVEQTTDMDDPVDDPTNAPQPSTGKTSSNSTLLTETDAEKTPSSPTRRKLPKTPV